MTDEERYTAYFAKENPTMRDLDIDAFADGVVSHRTGLGFHENPHRDRNTIQRWSWSMGWNERALATR